MRFCNECKHALNDKTNNKEFYYECSVCNTRYKSSPEDSLRFFQEFKKKSKMGGKGAFTRTAAYDVTNPKVYKKCPSCKANIVTSIISGDNMTFTYLCKCGNRF